MTTEVIPPSEDAVRFSIQENFDVWQPIGSVEVMIRGSDPIGVVWVRELPQATKAEE